MNTSRNLWLDIFRAAGTAPKLPTAYHNTLYSQCRAGASPRNAKIAALWSKLTQQETRNLRARFVSARKWVWRSRILVASYGSPGLRLTRLNYLHMAVASTGNDSVIPGHNRHTQMAGASSSAFPPVTLRSSDL